MPDFAPVRSGQALGPTAREWNAMLGAGQAYLNNTRYPSALIRQRQAKPFAIVMVENNTGGDRLRLDVAGITGVVHRPSANYDEWVNHFALTVEQPNTPEDYGRWVVFAADVPAGGIGPAYVDGIFPTRVEMLDQDHRQADVFGGVTGYLQSREGGAAELLFVEDYDPAGTQPTECLVRIGGLGGSGQPPFRAYIDQAPTLLPGVVHVQPTRWDGNDWVDDGVGFNAWYDADDDPQINDIVFGAEDVGGRQAIWSRICEAPDEGPVNP